MRPIKHLVSDNDYVQMRVLVASFFHKHLEWQYSGVYDSYWRLYVNSQPGAKVVHAGGEHPLRPGLVHLIPAWVRFDCRNTRLVGHFFIHFEPLGLAGSVAREIFDRPFAIGPGAHLMREIDLAREDLQQGTQPAIVAMQRVKAIVHLAFAGLLASLPPEQLARCEQSFDGRQQLLPALMEIDSLLRRPYSNARLAARCGLSEGHFIRQFHRVMGQSPAQYLIERRLAWAAQQLRYGDEPIEGIAAKAGFSDRFYFTRMFTRRMGISPARFRKGGTPPSPAG